MRITGIVILFLGSYLLGGAQEPTIDLDTVEINQRDAEGKKQGVWAYFGRDLKGKDSALFEDHQLVKCGRYKDNRKMGVWTSYYPNGVIKSQISYKYNRPIGPYSYYYSSGRIEREGEWRGAKRVGETLYFESGCIKKSILNSYGFKDTIVYHLDDCWKNGTNKGTVDSIITINPYQKHEFNEGIPVGTYFLDRKSEFVFLGDTLPPIVPDGEILNPDSVCLVGSTVNGYHKLFNDNQDLCKKGEFKNGKLWNGKFYIYDENGLLERIQIYKDGEFYGYGVLEF